MLPYTAYFGGHGVDIFRLDLITICCIDKSKLNVILTKYLLCKLAGIPTEYLV